MVFGLFTKKQPQIKCAQCGKIHSGSPSFAFKRPPYYFSVPEEERQERIFINEDVCQIEPAEDDPDGDVIYCMRVILEVPIIGEEDPFTWGVWVTQSKESIVKYAETFDKDQSGNGSFGWLAVVLPYYKRTEVGEQLEHLKCDIHWEVKGQRPRAMLHECEHQLYKDQHAGISRCKAAEIAKLTYDTC